MARYRQFKDANLIRNLTQYTYRVYTTTCNFAYIAPTEFVENEPEDVVYITSMKKCEELIEKGIDRKRIFFASSQGVGKDGHLIHGLYPYAVDQPRLVPHGG